MPPDPAENPVKRPSMRQIALLAGVSAMTVSRALRNDPRISAEVRSKVHKLALKMDYRPDPEVVKLMRHLGRRHKATFVASIAALTSLSADIEPPFLRRARENAQARAAELGYGLEVFHVAAPEEPNRRLERILLSRGITGVLLLQMHAPTRVDRLLNWEKFSAVVATPSVLAPDFPRVGTNYFHNALLLCEELSRRGCTRIGFAGPESFCIRTRYAAAAAASWQSMAGAGGTVVKPLVLADWRPGNPEFPRWFARERPDAVIVHLEDTAPFVAEQMGIPAQGPVVFACPNVNPLAPKLLGIDERHDLIGRKAVDVLTSLLNRNEKNLRASHVSTLIEGHWVEPENREP